MTKLSNPQKVFFNGFQTNEGAYFFRIGEKIQRNDIENLFKSVRDSATEFNLCTKIIREPVVIKSGKTVQCSLLVFKDSFIPDFIREVAKDSTINKNQIHEELLCYLLLIEIDEYIVLFSRHAKGQTDFKKKLFHVPGKELAGALLSMSSVFIQMRVGSMNMNPGALRNKSYEGDDLMNSMPMFDSRHSIVKATRINTDEGMVTISLSTSRISKIGETKKFISELCDWADRVVDGVEHPFDISTTLLGQFSAPIKWEEYFKQNLIPDFILFDWHELTNGLESGQRKIIYKQNKDSEAKDLSDTFMYNLQKRFSNCHKLIPADDDKHFVCDESGGMVEINVLKRGLSLSGKKFLKKLYVTDGMTEVNLVSYIHQNKCYFVGFNDISYIYFGNELHKDGNIGNTMQAVLSIFEGVPDMINATDEKGSVTHESNDFDKNSVFKVVEKYYSNSGATHIICDDLGNEWADHIVLTPDKISFVHSKADKRTGLSASIFQVVIAQATKNIGNIRRLDIDGKVSGWRKKKYSDSNIDYCRKGDLDTFSGRYKQAQLSPNTVREVCLAVNFIKKSELEEACKAIINTGQHKKKNYVIQLIWLINAFISTCRDAGLQARILCK